MSTKELLGFLAIARGSAGEVRSMVAVVQQRRRLVRFKDRMLEIRQLAESCARQITAWILAIEKSPVKGKRHLVPQVPREAQQFKKRSPRHIVD